VRIHFSDRPIARRREVHGVPVAGAERTIADMLRRDGWTEQSDLAVRESIGHGLTTPRRLRAELPTKWQSRLQSAMHGSSASVAAARPLHEGLAVRGTNSSR
jgi:hypothetical protein